MSDLAKTIKDEMARIARKTIRSETSQTKKASTQHRRDIADLKRKISTLTREVAFLRKQEKKRAVVKPSADLAKGARFSPVWVKENRKKLGLSAADYSKLVGVSAITIYGWEQGRSKPRQAQLASPVAVRKLGVREARKLLEDM